MARPTWFFLEVFAIFCYLLHLGIGVSTSSEDPLVQQELDRIVELPGQNFEVNFEHFSGYITVNEDSGRALFYWFVEAVEDSGSKPLLLWLTGGPGCSSIAYGEAEEVGPFHINADGKSLYLNPYSWNEVANIIFIESPVGVGFSYSNTSSDLLNNGDKRTAEDSLSFLLKWFERFSQFKGRDFYIIGESYGGHYAPQLSQAILRNNLLTIEKSINLKGYMVGNAVFDYHYDRMGVFNFLWSIGLISDQTYTQLNLHYENQSFVHHSKSCDKILDVVDKELGNIDPFSIYTPSCADGPSNQLLKRMHMVGREGESFDPCTKKHSIIYFNLPKVQKALHVDSKHAPSKWEICSYVVNHNWKDAPGSVLDIYQELIHSGLRIWVFSGDADTSLPTTSTRYSINALKLPLAGPWRAWYGDGQVGGWIQEYEGLTLVALQIIKAYLSGNSLPSHSDT